MRFFPAVLLLVVLAYAQSQLVVPQLNNLNALESLRPQIKNFLTKLDQILPQLANIISKSEIQTLKDKIVQVVLSHIGKRLDINAIKDLLRPVLQQYLAPQSTSRFNFDAVLQNIAESTIQSLPSIVISLIGKRDATESRLDLTDMLSLADKFQLANYIPQISQLLSSDKLQSLYNQLMSTGVLGLLNQWNPNTMGQAVQQLITQFIPQLTQSRFSINWEKLGGHILQGAASALPGLLLGLVGKRDLGSEFQQLLSSLSVQNLGEIVQIIRSGDRASAFAKLKKLLEKFFPGFAGRFNFDDMANNLINHVNNLLTPLSQSVMSSLVG